MRIWCWDRQQSLCHHEEKVMRKSERPSQNSAIVELLNEAALEFSLPDFLFCEKMNVLAVYASFSWALCLCCWKPPKRFTRRYFESRSVLKWLWFTGPISCPDQQNYLVIPSPGLVVSHGSFSTSHKRITETLPRTLEVGRGLLLAS